MGVQVDQTKFDLGDMWKAFWSVLTNNGTTVTPVGLPTTMSSPLAANVLNGYRADTATTAAATIATVPAGRTWIGTITISCDVGEDAAGAVAGRAQGIVTTAGTGVTPPAGSLIDCEARAGANAATGTVGSSGANSNQSRAVVIAPAGNSVTIQAASTIAGTNGRVSFSAIGELQ